MVPPDRAMLRSSAELSAAQTNIDIQTLPEFKLPISKFDLEESYDSARECKEALGRDVRDSPGWLKHDPSASAEYELDRWLAAKCIASDDPRLAR
jgi:hypothetical protein